MMKWLVGALAALFIGAPAYGQSVQYNPPVTAKHLPVWVTGGVIADGGTSADSPISSIGATGQICSNSARISTGAWNSVCLQAFTNQPGVISIQNYGLASAQGLNFNINGTVIGIPTGGGTFIFGNGPFTVGDVPCFVSTGGVVQDCGLALSSGTVTAGVWQGTPVALGFGGTGATSASGARTALGLGTMATQNASAVAITGGTATGLPTPVNPADVAIKSYVDSVATGLNVLPQTALATAAVLPNTPTYANGTAGVGATLTAGTNSTLTVDGTVATINTVVLVKNQASAFQNGVYTVTTAGSGSAAWVLTRATYFDTSAQMTAGSYTFVTAGSTNANSSWILQSTVTTVGTTSATFNQFSSSQNAVLSLGGLTGVVTLGNGLTTSGNSIVNNTVAGAGIALTGTTQFTIAASLPGAAVSGTNATYSSGQCSENVERSNSGTAMADTLPGTGTAVLPANCILTVTNSDASALMSIVAASGTTIKGATVNGFLYLGPGQTLQVQSDGSNYWPISVPARIKLAANTTIFVSTVGSDTTASGIISGSSFLTTNHAWAFAQSSLDLNGFVLTISHATGTYAQAILLQGLMLGQNGPASVIIQGNTSTPSNVSFPGAGGATTSIDVEGGAQLQLQGVTLTSVAGQALVVGGPSTMNFQLNAVGTSSGSSLTAVRNGLLQIVGSYSIIANQSVHFNANAHGTIAVEAPGVVITVTGNITQEFALAQSAGMIFYDFAPTYSGSMTGTRWSASGCGQISTGGVSFPGSISGATTGSCPSFN